MHGFITLRALLKNIWICKNDVRKPELVCTQEECVLNVKRTQAAAVILIDIIDREHIVHDDGT